MDVLSSRVVLRPRSLERSLRFYEEVLGLAVYREWGEGEGRGVVFFAGGGFVEVSGRGASGAPGPAMLWLQVRDVEATRRELEAAGATIAEPPRRMPWGLIEMRLYDPDELAIVIVEVPEDHPLRRR